MFGLSKKKDEFQGLLLQLAAEIHAALLVLKEAAPGSSDLHDIEVRIKAHEHRGDELIRELIARLNRAFITPFDREDLHRLSELMDDVMDLINACAVKMHLYNATEPIPRFAELAGILELQVGLMKEALGRLHESPFVLEKCREINDLEDQADHVYHQMIRHMFETESNPIRLIKNKEIIEDLEAATDACEDVADALESVVVKYA